MLVSYYLRHESQYLRNKPNPSPHARLLTGLSANSATKLLRRLLCRALPERAPWAYYICRKFLMTQGEINLNRR